MGMPSSSATSQIAAQRTFVSGLGNDSNTCSRSASCRTFGQAISQTNSSGEVYVLDSAGYAAFTITKPISIVAPLGVTAGISVFSGDGITINAGGSDTVILTGLTVSNQGSSGSGIVFNSGRTLHVESCVANGFSGGSGISVVPSNNGAVFVRDTIARGNNVGLSVHLTGTAITQVTMDQVHLDGNSGKGLEVLAVNVTIAIAAIRNSSASGNGGGGMSVGSTSRAIASLDIESCLIANNTMLGIETSSASTAIAAMSISNCTISHGGVSFIINGGSISSRGNNTFIGSPPGIGSLTPLGAQ